jgi:hypothetical protein
MFNLLNEMSILCFAEWCGNTFRGVAMFCVIEHFCASTSEQLVVVSK